MNNSPKFLSLLSHFNVSNSDVKSEEIFNLMSAYLALGHGTNAVKKCGAVYQVDILKKKKGKVVLAFNINLKDGNGSCNRGTADKFDAKFTMVDNDFFKLCNGKLNPQMAFIRGKMKIKGSMKKATLFTPDLFPKPTAENIAKYSQVKPKL